MCLGGGTVTSDVYFQEGSKVLLVSSLKYKTSRVLGRIALVGDFKEHLLPSVSETKTQLQYFRLFYLSLSSVFLVKLQHP